MFAGSLPSDPGDNLGERRGTTDASCHWFSIIELSSPWEASRDALAEGRCVPRTLESSIVVSMIGFVTAGFRRNFLSFISISMCKKKMRSLYYSVFDRGSPIRQFNRFYSIREICTIIRCFI